MRKFIAVKAAVALLAGSAVLVSAAAAQTQFDKKAFLKHYVDTANKIPAKHRALLSSGYQNFLALAERINQPHLKAGIGDDGGLTNIGKSFNAASLLQAAALGVGPGGVIQVSNPAFDYQSSVTTGFTQSETSSAWCGNRVVGTYNDSGAFLRTAGVNFRGAWSFNGVSVSANGGKSFVDLGYLNPGADPANFLGGDPVVTCTSPTQFYYSSIFATATPPDPNGFRYPLTAVSVSSSSSGGAVWGSPVAAVAKDGFAHGLDKPWMAVDPTNPLRLFVTYTDFDGSGTSTGCPNDFRIGIELVKSEDGGNTWTQPIVIAEECGAGGNGIQGSNVVVSPGGKVYIAYEWFPGAVPNNEIRFTWSGNHGTSFSKPITAVSGVVPNGDGGHLQGGFRNNEFPQLAVDRTTKSTRGNLYLVWSDGRNNSTIDISTFSGTYTYPDVLISKSTNYGGSWSAPTAVSPTPSWFTGNGRDQFFPGVAVDKNGHVGVCYYDRRQSADNSVVDRYCSTSTDGGSSWNEQQVSFSAWTPVHSADGLINPVYMGDYDALTSDFLLQSGGFFGTFEIVNNGNPDVYGKAF